MFKPVVIAAAVLACAPLVLASTADVDTAAGSPTTLVASADTGCRAAIDPGCPLHLGEQGETAAIALPESTDLVDGRPAGTGLEFKDSAIAPAATLLAPPHERDGRKPLLPALFALLAMVVLLSRRHTSF